jgi:hypothetical protein
MLLLFTIIEVMLVLFRWTSNRLKGAINKGLEGPIASLSSNSPIIL